jgi:putative ABC transport system ATP-binding protein
MLTILRALRSAQQGSVRILGQERRGAVSAPSRLCCWKMNPILCRAFSSSALPAKQNVELGLRVTGRYSPAEQARIATEMLEAVGLAERIHYKGEALSGGQRQRVAIARALAAGLLVEGRGRLVGEQDGRLGREVVDRIKVLAKEKGTTILLVTHDNRILDVADRIVHLEDGRLSTFTDAVIANNELMMRTLAENRQKQPIEEVVDALDEKGFLALLAELVDESQRFQEATALANDRAFQSMLEQSLFVFTRKLGQLLSAERASLFVVEPETNTLRLRVAQDLPEHVVVRLPIGTGIAGAAAQTGKAIRVDDAYKDPRFNQDVDRQSGFRTRAILALPIKDRRGHVFAVAQLLNRRDGRPFEDADEKKFSQFVESLGYVLETLESLGGAGTGSAGA